MVRILFVVCLCGCAQEMDNQRRVQPQERVEFFDDHLATRPLPEHVVPAADRREPLTVSSVAVAEPGYETGRAEGELLAAPPASLLKRWPPEELLRRGRERFSVSCVPCHDPTGSGNGMVARRGFPYPPTYHSDRLRAQPLGYFFAVATEGKGKMPPLGDQIPTDDRWAIATYVRALQLSQYAPAELLDAHDRDELKGAP